MSRNYSLIVAGGGAAGFFGAIRYASLHKNARVLILEKSPNVLGKVKVSGGGRCNVTHACFNPEELVLNYPRGQRELLGPLHVFQPADTLQWFEKKGVPLNTEADGRMFPVTNNSQTIIDCFLSECEKLNIEIQTQEGIKSLRKDASGNWQVMTTKSAYHAANILMAAGSSEQMWNLLKAIGHNIVPPVPSLFTFNIKHALIHDLKGVSVPKAEVFVKSMKLSAIGPLLITHWGLSGPAILRLSAWGARKMFDAAHSFTVTVNWNPAFDEASALHLLLQTQKEQPKLKPGNYRFPEIPSRLWNRMLLVCDIAEERWADVPKKKFQKLARCITHCEMPVRGKSTFKEEFVTCGGIKLSEVDFKTMQSKLHEGLFFAGEILDIDAITGGFNFQAAWTTSWIAAGAMR